MPHIAVERNMPASIAIIQHVGAWMRDHQPDSYSRWWDPSHVSTEMLSSFARPEEFHIASVDGQPAATAIIQTTQTLQDWSNIDHSHQPPPAIYLTYVAVEPTFASNDLIEALVKRANALAHIHDTRFIRLDTDARDSKLCHLYESLDFVRVATIPEGARLTAFYQKLVRPTH